MFSRNLFSGASAKKDHRFDAKSHVKNIQFSKKVTESLLIDRINSASFSNWVADEMAKLTEEDFAADLVMGFLDNQTINSQEIGQQLRSMIGEEKAISFVEKLWPLLIEAQNNETGIPSLIMEETQKRIAQRARRNEILLQKMKEENMLNDKSKYLEKMDENSDSSTYSYSSSSYSTSESKSDFESRSPPPALSTNIQEK